jgi:hypothetical protein
VVRPSSGRADAYAANAAWWALSVEAPPGGGVGTVGPIKVMVDADRVAGFFAFVREHHDGTSVEDRSARWPSDMASAFMALVPRLFELVPDQSKARALTHVMTVLASAAKVEVVKVYSLNAIFTGAFETMFGCMVRGWLAKDATIRDALYQAYKDLLVVSTTTTKESFDFLMAGAACFPRDFSQVSSFMRTFEDRCGECLRGVVAKFYEAQVK